MADQQPAEPEHDHGYLCEHDHVAVCRHCGDRRPPFTGSAFCPARCATAHQEQQARGTNQPADRLAEIRALLDTESMGLLDSGEFGRHAYSDMRWLLAEVDQLRAEQAIVAAFIAEREQVIQAIKNCRPDNASDYNRWQGHAEARRRLDEELAKARRAAGGEADR